MQKEQIIDRIKKLKAHAESAKAIGSLEEAESFMKKVTELLNEYNISMFEVDQAEDKKQDPFKNWAYSESISYDDKHQGWQWKKVLMGALTDYNFTNYTYNERFKTLRVYGNMENVDTTIWLYNYLSIGLFNLAHEEYKKELERLKSVDKEEARLFGRTGAYKFKRDFLLGAIRGFEIQLEKQRQANNKVRDIAIVNKDQLKKYIAQKVPNIKDGKPMRLPDVGFGFALGVEAGKNFTVGGKMDKNTPAPKKVEASKKLLK